MKKSSVLSICKYHKVLSIAVLYAAILLFVFSPVVFGGKSLYPYAFGRVTSQVMGRESIEKHVMSGGTYWDAGASDWIEIPVIEEMGHSIRKGESILWDAYNALGIPVIPNSSTASSSPFELIPILFPGESAWNFLYLFRLWFMMLFSYLFLKELAVSTMPSFLGGGMIGLFGYSMYHMNMWHFNVDAVLPLLMFVTVRYLKNNSIYRWGWLCLSASMMMLGGNPQNLITGAALAHLYYIAVIASENNGWKEKIRKYIKYCSAYIMAVCWSMFFWMPFLELFANGYNYHADGSHGLFSVPVINLLGLCFPGIYVNNAMFYVYLCYIGISVVPIMFLYTNHKDKRTWVFLGFSLLFSLKMLGFPLVQWIGKLPVLNMIHYWKYSFSFYFSTVVVFTYAMETFIKQPKENKGYRIKRRFLTVFYLICISAAVAAIYAIKSDGHASEKIERWIPFLLLLIGVWVITLVCRILEERGPKRIFVFSVAFSICMEIIVVPCYLNYFRIDSGIALETDIEDINILKSLQKKSYDRIATLGNIFMGNLSSNYGLYNIAGYTAVPISYYFSFMKELVLNQQLDINYMDPVSTQYFESSNKYLDMMGVSHVVIESIEPLETDSLQLVYENGYLKIYKNDSYFDKAFYVYDYEQLSGQEEIFKFLKEQEDLSQKIAVESDEKLSFQKDGRIGVQDEVEVIEYTDGTVTLACNSNKDGFLVLNDLYYPGWKVYVDGKEEKIYKTDYIFRSIYLKAGKHEVVFAYQPQSFYIGVLISGISILVYVGGLCMKAWKEKA